MVEAASIDEAYLDITGARRMFGSPSEIGEHVRAVVADEQQIACSVGIGPTKFVAKVASKQAKPDGLVEVPPDRVEAFLHPLPVEAMWGVGVKTAERLHNLGITTIGDLAHTPRAGAANLRSARRRDAARAGLGTDGRPVVMSEPERSIGSQETFGADSDDMAVVRRELLRMADKTAGRMRKASLVGRTVTISVRFADFADLTRSETLPSPTDVTEQIYAVALGCTNDSDSTAPGSAGSGSGSRAWCRPRRPACSRPDRARARLAGGGSSRRRRRGPVRPRRGAAGGADPADQAAARPDLAATESSQPGRCPDRPSLRGGEESAESIENESRALSHGSFARHLRHIH